MKPLTCKHTTRHTLHGWNLAPAPALHRVQTRSASAAKPAAAPPQEPEEGIGPRVLEMSNDGPEPTESQTPSPEP